MAAEFDKQNIDSREKKEISDDLAESCKSGLLSHVNAINWLMNTRYKLGSPLSKSPLAAESDCFGIVINYPDKVVFEPKEVYFKDKKIVLETLERYFLKHFLQIPILHRYSGDILWTYAKNDDETMNDSIDNWALGIDCGNGQMMTTSDKEGPIVIQLNLYNVKNVYRYLK